MRHDFHQGSRLAGWHTGVNRRISTPALKHKETDKLKPPCNSAKVCVACTFWATFQDPGRAVSWCPGEQGRCGLRTHHLLLQK